LNPSNPIVKPTSLSYSLTGRIVPFSDHLNSFRGWFLNKTFTGWNIVFCSASFIRQIKLVIRFMFVWISVYPVYPLFCFCRHHPWYRLKPRNDGYNGIKILLVLSWSLNMLSCAHNKLQKPLSKNNPEKVYFVCLFINCCNLSKTIVNIAPIEIMISVCDYFHRKH
jgi:hypothetical protein